MLRRQRVPHLQAQGEVKGTVPPPQNWLQRLFSTSSPHRTPAPGIGENTTVAPISASAIASAENTLRWISKVPGSDRAQHRIGVILEMIKGLNV